MVSSLSFYQTRDKGVRRLVLKGKGQLRELFGAWLGRALQKEKEGLGRWKGTYSESETENQKPEGEANIPRVTEQGRGGGRI